MLTVPRWLSLCVVGIVAASLAASSAGAPLTPKPKTGKPSKVAYIVEKMASDAAKDRGAGRPAAHLSNGVVHATSDGALDVAIWSPDQIGGRERGELARLGIKIETAVSKPAERGKPPLGLVQALVPYDQLDALAALDWVGAVTPADYGYTDAVTSEGVAFHNADDVQARGINGAGVNVGVISDGVTTIASAVASGDLPNNVNVLNAGSGDEGTAMLEIVNDMAPGAGLLFDSGTGGVAGHVAAQTNLVTNGANVITEDKAFDQEPAFQQGAAASGAEGIASGNVSFHSSAGNQAQRHAARVAATGTGGGPDGTSGPYTNCSFTPDNVVAIAPGNDTTFDVTLGQDSNGNGASFVLQWSEPRAIFPTAGEGGFTDLDLYVMDSGLTQCFGQSVAFQGSGSGDTMEVVSLPGSLSGTAAKIVVDVAGVHGAVATPLIDLRWRNATSVDTPTRAGSLNPDSNYVGQATSEAALDAQNAGAIEPYSSGGPVQLISTTVCILRFFGACLAEGAGTSQTVSGPTWAAADDVTVSGVGGFGSPFTGTSAATPHGAGCDALLRDSLNTPSASAASTNARLASTAIDIAPAGQDNVTGFGQLDCLAAVNHPPVADAGGPYTTAEGTDVTLDGTASKDDDTGDSITYAWDFDNDGFYDDATGASPSFTAVGQDGAYPIGLQVTDTAGVTATDTTTVTVTNVPPTVGTITTTAPKNENTAVEISGSITDPGWLDPLTATIDFDDGTGAHPLIGTVENVRPDASLTYDLFHTWGDNGTYAVQICAADDDTSGNCLTKNVQVDNVKPTATIGAAGTTLVNGVPTFITHAGQSVAFSGNSVDPGSDDLTLTWDWGDGGASPDASTVYLVNPPNADPPKSPSIQPRNVTEPQSHTFGSACLYTITLASLDDDAGSTSQTATVIVTGNATKNRSAGYWYNQYRDRKASQFSDATLTCYLQIVAYMSKVFPEITNAGTIALATAVLNPPTMKTTVAQQFDRQLLAAWLNFANGSIELGSPVDTNGDGINDSTFVAAVTAAETVRIGPASAAALNAQKTILERINLRDGG